MPGKLLKDIVNLLLYGSAFIGLCAASVTALTFDLIGDASDYFPYIILIGVSTATLYSAHRVIGLRKLAHVKKSDRYDVIRKYKIHIWLYSFVWLGLTCWYIIPFLEVEFLFLLIPGGSIALAYVLPFLSEGKRLRDFGWVKILLIGWSWGWLTAFVPAFYFTDLPLYFCILIGIERMLFIIAITIPFEIRDLSIDASVGLFTMPSRLGMRLTILTGYIICVIMLLISAFLAFHFLDPAYLLAMIFIALLTTWIIRKSMYIKDDYFFSGLTDGTMIIVLILHWMFN